MNIKMMWKKVILTATAALTIGGASFAATPAETYAEAAQNTLAQPSVEYALNLDITMPLMGSMNINGTLAAKDLPTLQGKGAFTTSVAGNVVGTTNIYVEQTGKTVTFYYSMTKDDGQTTWKKQTQELTSEHAIADYLKDKHNVMSGVKSVQALGNNDYAVVFDSSRIYNKDTIQSLKLKYGSDEKTIDLTEKVLQALQQAGDITTTVTIDPTTKRITNIALPMTSQLRQIALTILENSAGGDTNPAVLKQVIMNSDMSLSVAINDLPAGIDFTIPQDIKNQAVASNK